MDKKQMESINEDLNLLVYNIDGILQNRGGFVLNEEDGTKRTFLSRIRSLVGHCFWWFTKAYLRQSVNYNIEQQVAYNLAVSNAAQDLERITRKILDIHRELEYELSEEGQCLKAFKECETPRVIQLVSVLNYGDAVGNDVIAFKNQLKNFGVCTEIFTTAIHNKLPQGIAFTIDKLPELREDDVIIYHFASKCSLFDFVKKTRGIKILRYHNITPPEFFSEYDLEAVKNTTEGLEQVAQLRQYIDYALPVSEFNKQDLEKMGYKCKMEVLPILIQFEDYRKKPSDKIIKKYKDGRHNIIFVGRVVPNKKLEDIIHCFSYYQKKFDNQARLIFVGSYSTGSKYYQELQQIVNNLKVDNVVFTGHIPFDEILGYYTVADLFLCLSEHEGFGVPLVEAMYFKVPIIAYSSTGVPYTLNNSGILIENKMPTKVAEQIHEIFTQDEEKERILRTEEEQLQTFDNELIGEQLLGFLKNQQLI